jgi:hypothetical protein
MIIIIGAIITSSLFPQFPGLGLDWAGLPEGGIRALEASSCLESTKAPMPSTRPQSLIEAQSLDYRGRGRRRLHH